MRRAFQFLSTSCICLGLLCSAHAQAPWPNKPITIVFPYPPGGSDASVRIYAERLSNALSVPVIVDYKSGAGGNIGSQQVARSAPDGYTLLAGTNGPLAINPAVYRQMNFDPQRDFEPVTGLVSAPQVLFVNSKVSSRNLRDLIDYSKSHPIDLTYASVSPGSASHLTMELLKLQTGATIRHIPYRGAGPAVSDVIGGQVSMMTVIAGSVVPHIMSGRVRALAVTSAERFNLLPDVPTLKETGIEGLEELNAWIALVAPKGTSKEIISKLSKASADILNDPDVVDRLRQLGFKSDYKTPSQLDAKMRSERSMWEKVAKEANVQLD